MNKDTQFLQEAYNAILEKKSKKDFVWVPPWLKGKEKEEAKEKASGKKKDDDKKDKKKESHSRSSKKEKKGELEEAYLCILESKHINKKFARRYNKVTSALLKADPGSKDYVKLKSERDDLVKILSDHNMSPADLDSMFTKAEKDELEPMTPTDDTTVPEVCSQCGDGHPKSKCPENCY